MKKLLLISAMLTVLPGFGQGSDPHGARSSGMANASLTFNDIWAAYSNQAGLAYLEGFSAGVFYENRFLIKEMAFAGAALAMPIRKDNKSGTIALSFSNFGYSLYREGKYSLAYAITLSKSLSVGVQLNYHNLSINSEDYGTSSNVSAELGAQYKIADKVIVAAHIFNPSRAKLNDFNDERIPTVLSAGASYQISNELIIAGEIEKDIDLNPRFMAGIEYRALEILYLRVGAASEPAVFNFGLGLKLDKFRFDLASAYHPVLGYSPQISLTYLPAIK